MQRQRDYLRSKEADEGTKPVASKKVKRKNAPSETAPDRASGTSKLDGEIKELEESIRKYIPNKPHRSSKGDRFS